MKLKQNQKTITFIFITIVLDMLGIGLIIPVLPDVIRRFTTDPSRVGEPFIWLFCSVICGHAVFGFSRFRWFV